MGHARESWPGTHGTGYRVLIHVGTRVIELVGAELSAALVAPGRQIQASP